jgi:RNA polymerase sigma factor (sigma-70 family)
VTRLLNRIERKFGEPRAGDWEWRVHAMPSPAFHVFYPLPSSCGTIIPIRGIIAVAAETPFDELMRRVRGGDSAAADELVRRYEPAIRRAVRIRLADSRLQRAFDSMDVCQSVMASFFVRAALGQYDLNGPEELLRLLATMARHKLADQIDRERADCRDNRRVEEGSSHSREVVGGAATPSREVAARELLQQMQNRLSPEERELAELRQQGMEWSEIAARVGGTSEGLRKRLARASARIAQELGLDDFDDE